MYNVDGAKRFDSAAEFEAVDDGSWVDSPAKVGVKQTEEPIEGDHGLFPEIETLKARAKELGITGWHSMKLETLKTRIAEAEAVEE